MTFRSMYEEVRVYYTRKEADNQFSTDVPMYKLLMGQILEHIDKGLTYKNATLKVLVTLMQQEMGTRITAEIVENVHVSHAKEFINHFLTDFHINRVGKVLGGVRGNQVHHYYENYYRFIVLFSETDADLILKHGDIDKSNIDKILSPKHEIIDIRELSAEGDIKRYIYRFKNSVQDQFWAAYKRYNSAAAVNSMANFLKNWMLESPINRKSPDIPLTMEQ